MDIKDDVTEAIGDTPLVRMKDNPELVGKLEYLNPGGSMKDRIGKGMLHQAENRGELDENGVIEPTSGNTGIGVALACIAKDYDCQLTISEGKSETKKKLMKALGASVLECPEVDKGHHAYYQNVAKDIAEETGRHIFNQYENDDNPVAHYEATGEEIIEQTDGEITHFVCAMGTGGTISGVGKRLKEHDEDIQIVGVDSEQSNISDIFYDRDFEPNGTGGIEGIGRTYKPGATWLGYVDEVMETSEKDAFLAARDMAQSHGILAGGSAGGVWDIMQRLSTSTDSLVVGLFADSADRYLDTIYDDEWMSGKGYLYNNAR